MKFQTNVAIRHQTKNAWCSKKQAATSLKIKATERNEPFTVGKFLGMAKDLIRLKGSINP